MPLLWLWGCGQRAALSKLLACEKRHIHSLFAECAGDTGPPDRHRRAVLQRLTTSASWLNQVEVWFSILQGQSLSGASFTTLKQLEQHIDDYVKAYNVRAEPFVWTKKKVRQRRFKDRPITQL